MSNKVKFGLENVHYSIITVTAGVPAYGTPVKIPGAVNLSLSPKGDKTEFYADNMAYFVASTNQGYDGNLEVALLPDAFLKDVLGFKADGNSGIFEDAEATAKDIALIFQFAGDASATRHILYNVAVARPGVESKTKGAGTDVATDTIGVTASPAIDTGYVKAKVEFAAVGYDTFLTEVYVFVPVV